MIAQVSSDANFTWSHQSATTASGLLATTAEVYAAAGKDSGLTTEDLKKPETIDYVRELEATVTHYGGESEDKVVIRMLAEGGTPLTAFVAQEQLVIFFNQNTAGEKLVAIYPKEGTFWMDHPLVLLDASWVQEGHRQTFTQFTNFVTTPEQQQVVLAAGYRPGDTGTSTTRPGSLITAELNVNADEPKKLLKVPSAGVLEEICNVWRLT